MPPNKVFFIAEAGVNHNGSISSALEMIDVAVEAGADAVKFQTAIPEEVISVHAEKAPYQQATTGRDGSQLDMVRRLHFLDGQLETHHCLFQHATKRGIAFLSTPFDLQSLDILVNQIGLRTLKIASGDVTNGPLLLAASQSGCDIILSTGMATLSEVKDALAVIAFGYLHAHRPSSFDACREVYDTAEGRDVVRERVTLLHCVTAYPAPIEATNLRAMNSLAREFGTRVGLSDHSVGSTIAIAAAALDASVIEKHFTLDRSLPGPDHAASLEPDELKALIVSVREVERALGSGCKEPQCCELENCTVARRSLVARVAIARGEEFSAKNVASKRPAGGLSPLKFWDVIGKRATRDYRIDEMLSEDGYQE